MGCFPRLAPARLATAAAVLWLLAGCGESARKAPPPSADPLPGLGHLRLITEPHTDDFDGMAQRRTIRALVVRSKTFYFFDGAAKRGLSYERLKAFEAYVNERRETGSLGINVIFLPVTRDQLIPALLAGYGDLAVANLTITPERQAQVDFSIPVQREVREILVTGPASEPVAAIEDLSGQTLHTRRSSSYHESLMALNERFAASGLPPVDIVPVAEHLEDEELLEMVNASLIPRIVIDSHKAAFWMRIFDSIEVRPDIVLRDQADIAWAFRPASPQLKAMVDGFLMNVREGSLTGNVLLQRYLKETRYVENALNSAAMRKFDETAHLFQEYGDRYDFDWLMVLSQAYQESRLDQSARSHAGAIGVMQVLPSTAADKNVNVGDITELDNNIHAGNKYLRFLRDRYFDSEPMDELNKTLFAFASYNAGPARISRLRSEAEQQGLDPNLWFDNVEAVAAQRIGRETVDYVSNIYKYWIAYRLNRDQLTQRAGSQPPAARFPERTDRALRR